MRPSSLELSPQQCEVVVDPLQQPLAEVVAGHELVHHLHFLLEGNSVCMCVRVCD